MPSVAFCRSTSAIRTTYGGQIMENHNYLRFAPMCCFLSRTTYGGRMVENDNCVRFVHHLLFAFARQQRSEQDMVGECWKMIIVNDLRAICSFFSARQQRSKQHMVGYGGK